MHMNTNELRDYLSEMTDERFEAFAAEHWKIHQQIVRGRSNRAADNSWATYDAIRAERARRNPKGA